MTHAFDHWNNAYQGGDPATLSWHQAEASLSLQMIARAGITPQDSVIDIGSGTAPLVDALLVQGLRDLTMLDLSPVALDLARTRLGTQAGHVTFMTADITTWQPARSYDLWHDRAVFHFLVTPEDRAAYLARLHQALRPGGHAVIATFAPDGPERCSGLPVARYSPETLAATLGPGFTPLAQQWHSHQTPWGTAQSFQYSLLRRVA